MYRQYFPFGQLEDGEQIGGDLGFDGCPRCCTPIKRPRGGELNEVQKDWNRVFSFYRTTVEHCIAQAKRFTVLGGWYRGHVFTSKGEQLLNAIIHVVFSIVALQVILQPCISRASALDRSRNLLFRTCRMSCQTLRLMRLRRLEKSLIHVNFIVE